MSSIEGQRDVGAPLVGALQVSGEDEYRDGPRVHRRRSARLPGYDYARVGAYFVTICTQDRVCLFGQIADGAMSVNDAGAMIVRHWEQIPQRFPTVTVDEFVVMPNHIHGVLVFAAPPVEATWPVAPLGRVIGAVKSETTVAYGRRVVANRWPAFRGRLWQRNYYEHVIRGDEALGRIRKYIRDNPLQWAFDRENPAFSGAPVGGRPDWER